MGARRPLERVADPRSPNGKQESAFRQNSERIEYLSNEDFELFGKGFRKYSPRFARSELQALGSSCLGYACRIHLVRLVTIETRR